MEQSFIAQKLDIHLLLPEIHNTFNIFIRAKYHQVPLKYIHRYRLRLATGDAEGVVSGGRGSFYARFSGEFSYRPGYQFKFPAELQIVVTRHFYAQNVEFDGMSASTLHIV